MNFFRGVKNEAEINSCIVNGNNGGFGVLWVCMGV
jgi:hypothetical protein